MEESRAVALLRYANFQKVGDALGVSRQSVAEWAKGRNVTPYRLRQLEELLNLGQQEEAAPPEWATRLAAGMAKAVISALSPGMSRAERAAALAYLALVEDTPPPNGDSPHGSGEAISPDESKPRERGRG